MIRIPCPHCGERDYSEFTYGGDANRKRPDPETGSHEEWFNYVFIRSNPRGPFKEYWHHVQGCRQWLIVERDTATHEVLGAKLAREEPQTSGSRTTGEEA